MNTECEVLSVQVNKKASDMTLREHFAGLAMQAEIAPDMSFTEVAVNAVGHADALIKELAK